MESEECNGLKEVFMKDIGKMIKLPVKECFSKMVLSILEYLKITSLSKGHLSQQTKKKFMKVNFIIIDLKGQENYKK